MIDLILNRDGGLVLAHDEKPLDGLTSIEIGRADGAAVLRGPGVERRVGPLRPEMLTMVADGMPGRSVRLAGWRLAKVAALSVRVVN